MYYVNCSDSLIREMGLSPTSGPGAVLGNKWISTDSRIVSGRLNSFKEKLSYNAFLQDMGGKPGNLTAAGSDTVNGVAVLAFKDLDDSTAYVAASSPHFLLRVAGPTSGPGAIDFTGWNHPVAVTAPPASEIYSGPGA